MKYTWIVVLGYCVARMDGRVLEEEQEGSRLLANVTLSKDSYVEFLEPEEGMIGINTVIKKGEDLKTVDERMMGTPVEDLVDEPVQLYEKLTGKMAPKTLADAQLRMEEMTKILPTSEEEEDFGDEIEATEDVEPNEDGGRRLGSCAASWWHNTHCKYHQPKRFCYCHPCKTNDHSISNKKSKKAMSKVSPYRGDIHHAIYYRKCTWYGSCSWKLLKAAECREDRICSMAYSSSDTQRWKFTLYNAYQNGWDRFVLGWDPAPESCYNCYQCRKS